MEKTFGQKISWVLAILSYLTAFGFTAAAVLYKSDIANDPIHASLMASVVFFGGCGIVLHVIARTRLKGLLSDDDVPPENRQ